jgi:hypothetical protein
VTVGVAVDVDVAPELLQAKTCVVASIDNVTQEFMSVFLATAAKVFGKNLQAALNLRRRI